MIILNSYTEGYKPKENEYLLKIRPEGDRYNKNVPTGFMTKLTQKGALPKAFAEWGGWWNKPSNLTIYILEEKFRSGWKLDSWRFGESQNWASLVHPLRFTVEIYLQQFLEIIKENEIKNGELMGNFKWADRKLIKE
jgi:hypothetical protein